MLEDNLLLRQIFLVRLVCGSGFLRCLLSTIVVIFITNRAKHWGGYPWSGLLHNVGSKSKIAECDFFLNKCKYPTHYHYWNC
uniref:Uncharacterized protein n=1 Tax=Gossypium raimondii TaxID=29730 RepID=A0A0D2VFF4_GOSRA|nr:hypothetical protein B456_013G146000 [Gossypium raimondii]